jgi:hypothetical protein
MRLGLHRHRVRWLLTGMAIGATIFLVVVLVLSQTVLGHRQVLRIVLGALADQVEGTIVVERVSGNLLRGALLHGVSVRGRDGEALLLADSAFLDYRLRSFTVGDVVINRLHLFDPSVFLYRLPDDTLWNFERIFPTDPERPPSDRQPVVIHRVDVVNGLVLVRTPWQPDEDASPAERERQVERALADTSRVLVEAVPGGFLRAYRFEKLVGAAEGVIVARDEHGGTSVRIRDLAGDLHVWRRPIELRGLRGALRIRGGRMEYVAERISLPGTEASSHGIIPTGSPDARLDVRLTADTASFADFRWLWPQLPERGGGTLSLIIERRPDEGILYLARDVRLRPPGTLLHGDFGVIVGDTLRFVDVNLDADPLDIGAVEALLPVELPVVGLRVGGVQLRTPDG